MLLICNTIIYKISIEEKEKENWVIYHLIRCLFDIADKILSVRFPPFCELRARCTLQFLLSSLSCRQGFIEPAAPRRNPRRRRRRRRRFGIPAFPYETNGMHKYFRRYSREEAEGGFSAATSACEAS